jgi:ABC-2 type transport system ATP-binding protein
MKQRLGIAAALLPNPKLLILDEPTNGLDPQGIHQIRDIIKRIASQGTTILLASHLLDEVEKVCSHVLVLRFGEILYSGTVDGMSNQHRFFELKAENNTALIETLKNHPNFEKISEAEGKVIVHFKDKVDAGQLNKYLFDKGIVLNHLVNKKMSLEEQFLALTNT